MFDKPNEQSKRPLNPKENNMEDIKLWKNKSFHDRLGVSCSATKDEIIKAFKKLSKKYHPDLVTNNELLRENFQEIQKLLGEAKDGLISGKEKLTQKDNVSGFNDYANGMDDEDDGHEGEEPYTPEVDNDDCSGKHEEFIKEPFSTDFIKETTENLNSQTFEFALNEVRNNMWFEPSNFDVMPKEILSIVEKEIIENFIKRTLINLSNLSIEEASILTNDAIFQMMQLGFSQQELVKKIADLKNAKNEKLKIDDEFNENDIIKYFSEKTIKYLSNEIDDKGMDFLGFTLEPIEISIKALSITKGVSREKLLQSIEKPLIEKLVKLIKEKLDIYDNDDNDDNNDDSKSPYRGISHEIGALNNFGLNSEKLMQLTHNHFINNIYKNFPNEI